MIGNSRGNVLMFALLAAGGMMGLLLFVTSANQVSDQARYVARIKAIQTLTELRLKTLAMQPAFYSGCNSSSGSSSCQIVASRLDPYRLIRVPGAKCAAGVTQCGIALENEAFNGSARVFTATLKYTGEKPVIAPVQVRVEVPEDLLQAQNYDCGAMNPEAPIFTGFDSAGKPICRGLAPCGDGQFISGINPESLAPVCKTIPNSVGCSANQFIGSISWSGGGNIQVTCTSRKDPFSLWPL